MHAHTTRPMLVGLASLVIATAAVPGAPASSLTRNCNDAVILGMTAAVTGLAVVDLATASASARRYNQQHLTVTPQLDPVRRSYGVAVSWTFGRTLRAPPPPFIPSRKSPGTAFAYSLGATAAPMGIGLAMKKDAGGWVFLSGLVVGPSVGHFYAGQPGRALGTIGLRGVGTTVGLAALVGCFDFSTW